MEVKHRARQLLDKFEVNRMSLFCKTIWYVSLISFECNFHFVQINGRITAVIKNKMVL